MATVRTGRAPHQVRDIGPAAGSVDGLSAIGRVSALDRSAAGLLVDRAQAMGSGPVERVAPGPAPAIASALPARREETTVTDCAEGAHNIPAPIPPPLAIPCGDCLHSVVCALRGIVESYRMEPVSPAEGLRLVPIVRVECDHYMVEAEEHRLLAASVRESAARAGIPATDHGLPMDVVRPAPFEDDREARRKKVAANLTQESRQRGADANRARAAAIRATREGQAIGLLREHGGNAEAVGKIMGVSGTAVRGWVARMADAGTLPDDVAALCAGSRGWQTRAS